MPLSTEFVVAAEGLDRRFDAAVAEVYGVEGMLRLLAQPACELPPTPTLRAQLATLADQLYAAAEILERGTILYFGDDEDDARG